MTQYYALLSIVFMISVVVLFDRVHLSRSNARFCKNGLLNQEDLERLQSIMSACQEG